MDSTKNYLQRAIFNSDNKRLVGVMKVKKLNKKKNSSFMCIVVGNADPFQVSLVQVKEADRNTYKVKRSWLLSELRCADGINGSQEEHEIDLHLDKLYKWFVADLQERAWFVQFLWRQCCKTPQKKTKFVNFPSTWTEDVNLMRDNIRQMSMDNETIDDFEQNENYKAITENEAKDFEKLFVSCDMAIENAESLMESLSKELADLDGENVHSVLSSEKRVEELLEKVEVAIVEADKVDAKLAVYDAILSDVKDSMKKMETINQTIATANSNRETLLYELENLIGSLELSGKHEQILCNADLVSPAGLKDAIEAANALATAATACTASTSFKSAYERLQAVKDQSKLFDRCKARFSQAISRHLNNLFIHYGNDLSIDTFESASTSGKDLVLPKRNAIRLALEPYTPLMHWVKLMDKKAFTALQKVYIESVAKLYKGDIHTFFDEAKICAMGSRGRVGNGSREDLTGKLKQQTGFHRTSTNLLGVEKEQWNQEIGPEERIRLDQVFERALNELESVCLAEQNFCVSFFQLDVPSPTTSSTGMDSSTISLDLSQHEPEPSSTPRKIDKQINEEVRRIMGEIFECLVPELTNFISHFGKTDGYYCMYLFMRLRQHVMSAQDTGSFLSISFGKILVQVKRSFDDFLSLQLKSIEECKPPKRTKCGILSFVSNFKDFAHTAEEIFKQTDRREHLDKAYERLVKAMFESIPRLAAEHPKTPAEVVKMENFHFLHDMLSHLKIAVLDGYRKEAKLRYNEALKNYVTQYFGRPLEKLNQFFEGVEAKMAQGVKESEVSYQMAFSKEQLKKVISQYPAREVKRGLEQLYNKVEKHLSEECNLLQVVWTAMQKEFLDQYIYLEKLMQRCYPGSLVSLEFSMDDILRFFKEIAKSH